MKDKADELTDNITKYLFGGFDNFVSKVFGQRKKEIEELFNDIDLPTY